MYGFLKELQGMYVKHRGGGMHCKPGCGEVEKVFRSVEKKKTGVNLVIDPKTF